MPQTSGPLTISSSARGSASTSILRRRFNSDTDSDTSSSGNESFSSSSSSSSSSSATSSHHEQRRRPRPEASRTASRPSSAHYDGSESSDEEYTSDISTFVPIEEDRTPRRVIRRKNQIQECIECTLVILSRSRGDVFAGNEVRGMSPEGIGNGRKGKSRTSLYRPWARLAELGRDVERDDHDSSQVARCADILQELLDEIAPLTEDKMYLNGLNGPEARAARSFRSSRPMRRVSAHDALHGVKSAATQSDRALSHIPLLMILRLTLFVLSHQPTKPTYLDLSRLPYSDVKAFLEDLDLFSLLSMVGSSPGSVTHLDLSFNNLTEFPFWLEFPFPQVQVINLGSNPHLSALPFHLGRLPAIRRIRHRRTQLSEVGSPAYFRTSPNQAEQSIQSSYTRGRKGSPALVDLALFAIQRLRRSMHPTDDEQWSREAREVMAPHLVEKLERSFICDGCLGFRLETMSDGVRYNPNRSVGWQVRSEGDVNRTPAVRLSGRFCQSCVSPDSR
ncbi:hypothetical protein IAR55_005358 [Kwoniella newhampshirensis]|uniref:Uncharacterized protein n=1 Tax=Kwoniella newhampshirensis TaxID=1651941 RepID=A0AAW0YH92_9TREE